MQGRLPFKLSETFSYCLAAALLHVGGWAASQSLPPPAPAGAVPSAVTRRQRPIVHATTLTEARQALRQATAQGTPTALGAASLTMGTVLQAQRDYEQAIRYFQQAAQAYQRAGIPRQRVRALRYMGRAQYVQGDTGQAHSTALQALRLARQLRNPAEIALSYAQMGDMYGWQRLWARALVSHEKAYAYWQQAGSPGGQAAALNSIGLAHFRLGHNSRALYYLSQALQQARQLRDSTRIGEALASTGQVYEKFGNYDAARGFYAQSLSQLPRSTAPGRRAEALRALAVTHDSVGNRPVALQLLAQAVPLAKQGGSAIQVSELYAALTEGYRRAGDYRSALATQEQYAALQDSVFAERRAAQVAELQTRYETEKKEREIQLLTKDRQLQQVNLQRQTLVRNVLAVGAVVLLLAVVALYRGRQRQHRVNRLLQRKNQAIGRQKEELGRLNRTKDTLFSIISHDLRSPLSSLYSLFTLMNMGTLPPERLAAHSQRLTRTLDVTLRLLDNLLNWSAAQMQGDQVRPEKVRLPAAIDETMALLLGDAERKDIRLSSKVPALSAVQADPTMVRLILRNLLGNAIKFTATAGRVEVSARFLEEQGQWEIAVADTGVGIAPADLPKIFGESGHHTTLGTALEKGTGLGLRLCKEFVERNGGAIRCDSQPGAGSTFRFTLPAAGAEALSAPVFSATAVAAG